MPVAIRRFAHRVAALLAVGLAATACPNSSPNTPQIATASAKALSPAKPAPSDQGLRDVTKTMLYSDGIAHVLPETAAQMICGALSPAEWSQMLGGAVGRTVFGGVDASCVVDTGALSVRMKMMVEYLGTEGERINGRRVKVEPRTAAAAVVASGEQDISAQQRIGAEPVLYLQARWPALQDPAQDLPALLRRLLTMLLPRLAPADKPAAPVNDATGTLAYLPTEPVAGVPIHDLPQTVQSRMLCTVVLRKTGIKLAQAAINVNSVGDCFIDKPQIFAKVDQFQPPIAASSPYQVAGRPAHEHPGTSIVINLLTMQPEYGRTASVTLRLQRDAPPTELRRWAEEIATAVLTG